MTPDVEKIWYQANLHFARRCEAWQKEITDLELEIQQLSTSQYALRLRDASKTMLQKHLLIGGSDAKKVARSGTKQAMIDFIITDRKATFEQRIAYLRQQIADNQPDPRWRERKEEQP